MYLLHQGSCSSIRNAGETSVVFFPSLLAGRSLTLGCRTLERRENTRERWRKKNGFFSGLICFWCFKPIEFDPTVDGAGVLKGFTFGQISGERERRRKMCGRARCTLRAQDVPRACGVNNNASTRTVQMDRYRPSFNVSPGFYMPVVLREEGTEGDTVVHCMKWGLIPSFTKKSEKPDHYRMFNARSESISEKASFRRLLPNNRCIVAVEGFYEWKKDGSKKQPYYIHFKDERLLVFAALYDSWKNSEGETIYTFTILTTSCSSAFEWLHDRMPVILGGQNSIDAWLNGYTPAVSNTVLKPYEDPDLVWYPVTPAMGKPSFDGPDCIKEIQLKADENHLISKFFMKKRVDNEQETKPQIKSSPQESACTEQAESLKELEKNTDQCSTGSEQNKYPKSDDSLLHLGEARKCGIKREYEELASDTKTTTDKNEKPEKIPVKKKGNAKSAGDKQPTLLSYFARN